MQRHALQTPCYLSQVQSSRARQSFEMSENGFGPELNSSSPDPLRSLDLGVTALILKGAWAEGRGVEHSGLLAYEISSGISGRSRGDHGLIIICECCKKH